MLCKKCNVLMGISGTSYRRKENKEDKGYARYNECPKCNYRKYNNNLPNFQETLLQGFGKWKKNAT